MTQNRIKILVMIVITITILSCSNKESSNIDQEVPPAANINSSTQSPTRTKQPFLTPTMKVMQTEDVTTTTTSVSMPEITLEERCLNQIAGEAPITNGKLVLTGNKTPILGLPVQATHSTILFDLGSGEYIDIGMTAYEAVSPNGNNLAYYDIDQMFVSLTNTDGKEIMTITSPKENKYPARWIDNQHLAMNVFQNDKVGTLEQLIIINPFLDFFKYENWNPGLPNQDDEKYFNWDVTSTLVFNPNRTHILYPAYQEGVSYLVLWDIRESMIIKSIFYATNFEPRWSPDGSKFVTSAPIMKINNVGEFVNIDDGLPFQGGNELLLVDIQGNVRRLTYFNIDKDVYQHSFVWSPSGRYIAFYLQDSYGPEKYLPRLFVIDVETSDLVNYCLLPEHYSDDMSPIFPPEVVWSYDEKYLSLTTIDQAENMETLLVEIETGAVWEIMKDMVVVGWLRNAGH